MNITDKKNLIRRKAELEQALINLKTKENELEANERKAQIEISEESLKMVREAMKRLEDDLYGYCILCDDELDRRILMKYPETSVCKDCESSKS